MNLRGEHVLLFGDAHIPNELIGVLEQQGAKVFRNAQVGRTASNFWEREGLRAITKYGEVIGLKPTKVVVMLGTDDPGTDPEITRAALVELRKAFERLGAEVWAIGPFTTNKPAHATAIVADATRAAFEPRYIDGRALSGARVAGGYAFALAIADALITAKSPKNWPIALALVGAGVLTTWAVIRATRAPQALRGVPAFGEIHINIVDGRRYDGDVNALIRRGYVRIPCKSGIKSAATCWAKPIPATAARAALAAPADDDNDADVEDEAEDVGSDDWLARINRRQNERRTRMREALANNDAVWIETVSGRRVLLLKTPEMSNPDEGSIRVTQFDEDGPIGHKTRATVDALAKEIADDWHPHVITPATEAEVMALTSTERFAEGAARVTAVQRANSGMEGVTEEGEGYRVAYGLVTRRDGQVVTVRAIVDAPRALTRAEAEKWVKQWKRRTGATTWVETMDGKHVPVKGAMRPGGFVDDARPGDVHATMTSPLKGADDRDDTIAHVVRDTASRAPRFGDRKVFVADVHRQLVEEGRDDGMTLDELKAELVRLHKAGKIKLARADLVAAMDPAKVTASETDAGGATFHFVTLAGPKRGKSAPTLPSAEPFDPEILLPQIDKQIEEGGGWANMSRLPGGDDAIWELINRGVLEEDGGFVRRRQAKLDGAKTPRDIEAAVHAARLYIGSDGTARIRDQQRLYAAMQRKIAAVAKRRGMDETDASEQITAKARELGPITPTPGKDF